MNNPFVQRTLRPYIISLCNRSHKFEKSPAKKPSPEILLGVKAFRVAFVLQANL